MRKVDQAKYDEKRRHILEAADECFQRDGFRGASISDICYGTERTSRQVLDGSGDLEQMEHRKLTNGSAHKLPIGHFPSPAPRDQTDAARRSGEKTVRKKAARKKV